MVNRSLPRGYIPRGYGDKPEKRDTKTFDKVMGILLTVLAGVLLIVTVLDRCGLKLIYQEAGMIGCLILVALLLGWGVFHLVHKIKNENTRRIVGLTAVFVLLLLTMWSISTLLEFCMVVLPHSWMTIASPEGKQVVLLRAVDTGAGDEAVYNAMIQRMDARKAAIEAAGEDTAAEQEIEGNYPAGSYGYIVTARPKVLGIFMNTKASLEGAVYLGLKSAAELEYSWTDPGLHITLKNPEIGDEGEAVLTLK